MTSSGRLLLLLLMMMMMTVEIQSATGLTLTCFSCTSSATKPACADPFDASGVDIGRCTSQLHCVAIRMTGGSLRECSIYLKPGFHYPGTRVDGPS